MEQEQLIAEIQGWAAAAAELRLVLLTGSRAVPDQPTVDVWSDYDVQLFVTSVPAVPAREAEWKARFGEVLVEISETGQLGEKTFPTRLVLYADGTKVDFGICPLAALLKPPKTAWAGAFWQRPYQVLVDKDKLASTFAHWGCHEPQLPTSERYRAVVNEFFWEVVYIAKNLDRNELWLAQYCFGVARREALLPMLEWYARSVCDKDTQYLGKGIKDWLSPHFYERLQRTYAGAGAEESWEALSTLIYLFRDSAIAVARRWGFDYPAELNLRVIHYLNARLER